MKKAFKRILSVAIGLCIALMGMFVMPTITASAETKKYVKVTSAPTDWSGEYLIVYEAGKVIFDGSRTTLDAASNTQSVTISNNAIMADNNYSFTIAKSGSNYTVKSASGFYIGQTSNANGLKSNETTTYANTISLNSDGSVNLVSGGAYLRFNAASGDMRFRYYKSSTYTGQKAICLYKLEENTSTDTTEQQTALNEVDSYMRLSYSYKAKTEMQEVKPTITDTLTLDTIGIKTYNSYTDWSGKQFVSDAVYAGNNFNNNDSIQLRSSNSNSGIITTASGGKVKKITVTWNSNTASGRTLDIYGKNTAYSSPTELYSSSTQGTKIGSIVCGTSTKLVVEGDYTYIGLRSNSSAMYLTEITIDWEASGGDASVQEVTTFESSNFLIQCAVDKALLDIENVEQVGILVTAGDKTKEYTTSAKSWTVDETNGLVYVVIGLGDIINDKDKLQTEFTVAAYIMIDGFYYVSEKTKTHSVESLVTGYYNLTETKEKVAHLYENLFGKEGN